jgi:hypothetical protein
MKDYEDEALKLALEAITQYLAESPDPSEEAVERLCDAASAARKALAQPEQEHDLSEQGRNRSAVLGNNIEAMMESGLSFLKALETTLKVYDHAVPKPPTASRSKT